MQSFLPWQDDGIYRFVRHPVEQIRIYRNTVFTSRKLKIISFTSPYNILKTAWSQTVFSFKHSGSDIHVLKYIFEISIKDTPLTAYFVQKSGMMQTVPTIPCAAPLNMLGNPLLSTCGSDTLVLHVKQIDGKGGLEPPT